jgi:hypothetical protein
MVAKALPHARRTALAQAAYLEFFRTENSIPILIIELEDLDFANEATAYQQVKNLIFQDYSSGVHRKKP